MLDRSGVALSAPSTLRVSLPVLGAVLIWLLWHTGGKYLDLEIYRLGVQTWLDGGDLYGLLPATSAGISLPFIYPPFAAALMVPLTMIPWTAAWILLLVGSVASLAASVYVTTRRLWPVGGRAAAMVTTSVVLAPALRLEPVLATIEFGQINLILMALVAVDCLAYQPRWPRGLLVGIAAAIKLTPAAFVLFFLLRRDYRAAVTAAVTGVFATGIGVAIDPHASLRYWSHGPAAGVSGSAFYTNQTFRAVLARLGVTATPATLAWVALSAATLALAAPAIRRADASLALVVTAGVALLVSPTSWSHHWVWVAPALLVFVVLAVRHRSPGWAAVAALGAAVWYVAPYRSVPHGDGRELHWTLAQQLIGSSYVLLAAGLLVALWWSVQRKVLPG